MNAIERKARAEALNWAIENIKAMRDSYTIDAIIADLENARDYNLRMVQEGQE